MYNLLQYQYMYEALLYRVWLAKRHLHIPIRNRIRLKKSLRKKWRMNIMQNGAFMKKVTKYIVLHNLCKLFISVYVSN